MEEQKYLIAIALAELSSKRIMPIGGKTITKTNSYSQPPTKEAEKIILDILLRLFKRSNEGDLKIFNKDISLLLAEIDFKKMHTNLPIIKSKWINGGDTKTLLEELKDISYKLWSVNHQKYKGITFESL